MNYPGSIFPGEGRARKGIIGVVPWKMHEAPPLTNIRVVMYRMSEFVSLEKNQ